MVERLASDRAALGRVGFERRGTGPKFGNLGPQLLDHAISRAASTA
jgi:hypothetical protein